MSGIRHICWATLLVTLFALSCGTDAVLLPDDFNLKKSKSIVVDYPVEVGTVSDLSGVQGGPYATVYGDSSLLEQLATAGATLFRVPQGYLCEYTLSGIFPDATADASDPAKYEFSAIDAVLNSDGGTAQLGGRVVFQAIYDIGDTCSLTAVGNQQGVRPADIEKWSQVVVNIMRHFNKNQIGDLLPDNPWLQSAQNYNVRYVEFIDDPLGQGGYASVDDVTADFVVFAEAIKTAFPNLSSGERRINVVGPAMPIAAVGALAEHPIITFVDKLIAQGKAQHLDVLSFQTEVTHPYENRLIAQALREMLDQRGLVDVELWATRYNSNPEVHPKPTETSGPEVAAWSTYVGAYATATKIGWQGVLDAAVFYRTDRRHLTLDSSDVINIDENPLFSGVGDWRPAGVSWWPWRFMVGKTRLQVSEIEGDDKAGLAVIAAKDDTAPCEAPRELKFCPKVYVLVANANVHLEQTVVSYQIELKGVSSADDSSSQVRVDRVVMNDDTVDIRVSESSKVTLIGGDLFYQLDTNIPATDFLQIDLGEQ